MASVDGENEKNGETSENEELEEIRSKEFTTAALLVDLVSPTGPNSSLYLALVLDFLSRVMLNLLNLRSFTCIPQCSKKPPRVLAFLDLLLSISQSKQI